MVIKNNSIQFKLIGFGESSSLFTISLFRKDFHEVECTPPCFLVKTNIFIINFDINCNENFFYLFYLLISKKNLYLLTRAINATCKNGNF